MNVANKNISIGVLALQGAFVEHIQRLNELHIDAFEIRQKKDLDKKMDGIILPGGESTTMYKLLEDLDMTETLIHLINKGLPVLGTCAGLLLLAKEVENHSRSFLNLMDIKAKKNAYGRQLGSFRCKGNFSHYTDLEFVFIRAPYIISTSKNVEILAIHDEKIIAARQDNKLVTAFHPELSKNTEIHQYFLNMIT